MRILTHVNIDWLRWRWHTLALSWLIILSGVGLMIARGVPLGLDFSGGTQLIVQFAQPVGEEAIRSAIPGDEVVQRYGKPGGNQYMIRLGQPNVTDQRQSVDRTVVDTVEALKRANLATFEVLNSQFIGPVIGRDLQRRGIYATFLSMFGIMAYIAFRFRLSFGIGAMVASLHDVLITLSLLVFVGYELSLNIVAAILTLVGYGVNDQIVIFDRVRENLRSNRTEPMKALINKSVNQTLPRTVMTAGTTALAVLSLFLFGGEVLEPFAFTMLVGIITSTYSTVFIASFVAVLLSPRRKTTATVGQAPSRPDRKQRKARAS